MTAYSTRNDSIQIKDFPLSWQLRFRSSLCISVQCSGVNIMNLYPNSEEAEITGATCIHTHTSLKRACLAQILILLSFSFFFKPKCYPPSKKTNTGISEAHVFKVWNYWFPYCIIRDQRTAGYNQLVELCFFTLHQVELTTKLQSVTTEVKKKQN